MQITHSSTRDSSSRRRYSELAEKVISSSLKRVWSSRTGDALDESHFCAWTGSPTDELQATLDLSSAKRIIEEWKSRKRPVKARTASMRRKNALLRYSDIEQQSSRGIYPIDVVDAVLRLSRQLRPASWEAERLSFLEFFNWRIEINAGHQDGDAYIKPLAILILATKPPFKDERNSKNRPPQRAKSITQKAAEELFGALGSGTAANRARIFAQVTLLTGARPAEWRDAVVRPATIDDTGIKLAEDQLAIVFRKAKTREGEAPDYRIVLIAAEHSWLIDQHVQAVREALSRTGCGVRDSFENMCRDASTLLRKTAAKLWPRKRTVVTLYTFRNQTRANVTARLGKDIAAEVLGHSHRTARLYYADPCNAWVGGPTSKSEVQPSAAMKVAASESARRRTDRFASQPWQRAAPMERPTAC